MDIDSALGLVLAATFLASFGVCAFFVSSRVWQEWLIREPNKALPQRVHSRPTLRIGGLAVVSGLLAAYVFLSLNFEGLGSGASLSTWLGAFLVASLPSLFAGLVEDITHRVSVAARLGATFLSAGILIASTEVMLPGLGLPLLDAAFAVPFIAGMATIFCIAGVANAFNVADGFNGIASGTAILSLATIGWMAWGASDPALALFCGVGILSVLGFFVFNFPFGKIFLGDGGAYLIGLFVAFAAVLLPLRHTDISPWASLLACAYPVLDTLFSILRRRHQARHPGLPDRLHFHSLIYRRGMVRVFPGVNRLSTLGRNSLTGFVVLLLGLVPAAMAIFFHKTEIVLQVFALMFMLGYWILYVRMVRMRWCLPFLSPQGQPRSAVKPGA